MRWKAVATRFGVMLVMDLTSTILLHIPTNYALLVRASSTAGERGSNSLNSNLWGVEMGELSNTKPVSIEAMPPHRRCITLLTGQKSRS